MGNNSDVTIVKGSSYIWILLAETSLTRLRPNEKLLQDWMDKNDSYRVHDVYKQTTHDVTVTVIPFYEPIMDVDDERVRKERDY